MPDADLRALLKEGHDLVLKVLMRGALGIDIMPGDDLARALENWQATLQAKGIVNVDRKHESPQPR